MNLVKFLIFTTIGACMWNTFLTWVGFALRENWSEVMVYSHTIDLVVLGILAIAFIYYAIKIVRSWRSKKTEK